MKTGKRVQIKWLDAWIENELSQDELDNLKDPKTVCTLLGTTVFEDDNTVGIAAEHVIGMSGDISWRAITFVPKCLIIETKTL